MKIGDKNLFPLNNINSRLNGYLMDRDGNIYSVKNTLGRVKMLAGSKTSSGHYFTLSNTTYRGDQLFSSAKAHKLFNAETAAPTTPASVTQIVAGVKPLPVKDLDEKRSYAKSLAEGIALRGVMIAAVEGERLVFGSEPKIHVTEQSFRSEMERLARVKPGVKFVSVKITGSVVAGGVRWE
jgi:hypothetical protein